MQSQPNAITTGLFHLSREKPRVQTAADGTWSVSLRVLERQGQHSEARQTLYSGPVARTWWESEGHTLQAGDSLHMELAGERPHAIARGRDGFVCEIHAKVLTCAIVARADKREAA